MGQAGRGWRESRSRQGGNQGPPKQSEAQGRRAGAEVSVCVEKKEIASAMEDAWREGQSSLDRRERTEV
eukprot:6178355-Pleurochrysis_carterae.AAC.2